MADVVDPDSPVEAPKKRKILLILPVVALLLGGGGGYYQYQQATVSDEPAAEEAAELIEYGQFAKVDGIIVNPAESGGRRYLMVDLALEAADEETLAEVGAHEVVIRDAIVRLLGERTVDELAAVSGRAALKDTIRAHVNGIVTGEIDRLYFTQYVLQ
ncbi:flagellar basal body-associated FliL family protein [Rubrivirga sp. S365]|uniref:Flagellar protein FliL n=1 Tax=Rubrivirga litoralis TaxID=3075598 RepID=A0ABU3BPM6_9BACT|nr:MULTISPECIES: flagellar basal body-associated FliL family protein [unclassified Rubrivirga]MDT0631243.1 flagellar basal body-associated FliL family protein [Rubrivirga sp. F394]MDT7856054.1 flagellar basal body-associated FliL family protein [Rubrivirga sp. S365]